MPHDRTNETHEMPKCTVIKHSVQTKDELRDPKKISGNGKVDSFFFCLVVTLENWLKIEEFDVFKVRE